MTPSSCREKLIMAIEESIQDDVVFLTEVERQMNDAHPMKEYLKEFQKKNIKFFMELKNRVENGI